MGAFRRANATDHEPASAWPHDASGNPAP
jgi:hypothetical protein